MQSTSCCRSCDASARTSVIEILGKPVRVKNYFCSKNGDGYQKKPDPIQMQLSVCPTSFCPAGCPFCAAKNTAKKQTLDPEKFAAVMKLLKAEDRIRGVKITGGEPFTDVKLLNEVIRILFEIFGYGLEVSVSTNGMGLDRLREIKDLSYLESIHISRHHYDDLTNRTLFGGADVPSGKALREIIGSVPYPDLFVFNCMLLKGYIDSPGEAHRFLDFAIASGVPKVGFVTCSPVKAYAEQHSIPFEDVIQKQDPALLFTRCFDDYEFCHCSDGVYASEGGEIVEFYGRSTKMGQYSYSRGLVYDADDHLRDGFGGNVIR